MLPPNQVQNRLALRALAANYGTDPDDPVVNEAICQLLATFDNRHHSHVREKDENHGTFARDWREYDPDTKYVVYRKVPKWAGGPNKPEFLTATGGWSFAKTDAAIFTEDEAHVQRQRRQHGWVTFAYGQDSEGFRRHNTG